MYEFVELALAEDEAWFAAHPNEEWRVRRRMLGEFGDLEGVLTESAFVVVRRTADGRRYRSPIPEVDAHAGTFDVPRLLAGTAIVGGRQ